jgi:hypothetical protein
MNQYVNFINNATPEYQIEYLEGEIKDFEQFIQMYKEDSDEENIKFCENKIIRHKKLIENVKNGYILTITASDIETNML